MTERHRTARPPAWLRIVGSAWACVVMTAACRGRAVSPPSPAPAVASAPRDAAARPAPAAARPRLKLPAGTRSLRLRRTVGVRLEPAARAKRIGNIAINTRVAWTRTARGPACKRAWVEIAPRGWVCGSYLAPSKRLPSGREVPHLRRGDIVPGTYGKITKASAMTYVLAQPARRGHHARHERASRRHRAAPGAPSMVPDKPVVGSVNVRRYGEVTVAGKDYWKISPTSDEYVRARAIRPHVPSRFFGVRLSDDTGWTLPIGFVSPRGGTTRAYTLHAPHGGGVKGTIRARAPVRVLEVARDRAGAPLAYRIGDRTWIAAADVRVFHPLPPPRYLRPHERWIDVDLDTQILVAYEGDLPVYATLVSSGVRSKPTEPGVYRMWMKESEADMKNLGGEDPYSVATVPWTQFFSPVKGLALHTAYWHDGFGHPRSHGCVNLSPRDARWLYFWSDPQVPPGWTMAAGVVEAPGSIVRIRSAAAPDPPYRGYATRVLAARKKLAAKR